MGSLVPSSFASVCQVFHPWWGPGAEPTSWRTWPFVAGPHELVDRLLDHDRLEVARTTFDAAANRAAEPS